MKAIGLLFAAVLGLFAWAGNAEATVLRVVVVETGDQAAYLQQIEQVKAHYKRLGSTATVRVWRARFAGTDAGAIVVAVEYKDMADFAATDAKATADPGMQATMKTMGGMRKIVSDSLYEEL